jgi:hypothetical protein
VKVSQCDLRVNLVCYKILFGALREMSDERKPAVGNGQWDETVK